jgi:hypothetical protein
MKRGRGLTNRRVSAKSWQNSLTKVFAVEAKN